MWSKKQGESGDGEKVEDGDGSFVDDVTPGLGTSTTRAIRRSKHFDNFTSCVTARKGMEKKCRVLDD